MNAPAKAGPAGKGSKAELVSMRLDKWLWAARLFKTRALAAEAAELGRISVNDTVAKPARDVRVGDRLQLRQPGLVREFTVRGLSMMRGPAPVAQALLEETPASITAREAAALRRSQGVEPAQAITGGRPTKRDRREITDWQRWSASLDESGS